MRYGSLDTTSKQRNILYNGSQISPKPEKSATEQMKYEGHAGCFLRLPKFYAFVFIPRGPTVNQEFYLTVFGRLSEAKEITGRLAATQLVSAPLSRAHSLLQPEVSHIKYNVKWLYIHPAAQWA
jgi:hypothetical protein